MNRGNRCPIRDKRCPTWGKAGPTSGNTCPTSGKRCPTWGKGCPTSGNICLTLGNGCPTSNKRCPTSFLTFEFIQQLANIATEFRISNFELRMSKYQSQIPLDRPKGGYRVSANEHLTSYFLRKFGRKICVNLKSSPGIMEYWNAVFPVFHYSIIPIFHLFQNRAFWFWPGQIRLNENCYFGPPLTDRREVTGCRYFTEERPSFPTTGV
jgi:hypothetical protein